ncbi:unnamed protein product [Closterium sp. NIES-54]
MLSLLSLPTSPLLCPAHPSTYQPNLSSPSLLPLCHPPPPPPLPACHRLSTILLSPSLPFPSSLFPFSVNYPTHFSANLLSPYPTALFPPSFASFSPIVLLNIPSSLPPSLPVSVFAPSLPKSLSPLPPFSLNHILSAHLPHPSHCKDFPHPSLPTFSLSRCQHLHLSHPSSHSPSQTPLPFPTSPLPLCQPSPHYPNPLSPLCLHALLLPCQASLQPLCQTPLHLPPLQTFPPPFHWNNWLPGKEETCRWAVCAAARWTREDDA